MTQKEKLIELISDELHWTFTPMAIEHIADFLIANGVVVLPCKVGDTVYVNYIYGRNKIITDSQMVYSIEQTVGVNDESYWKVCAKQVIEKGYIVCHEYTEDDFGKTVFLTCEEAEAALKKMEEHNGN